MHRQKSKRSLRQLKLIAMCYFVTLAAAACAICFVAAGLLQDNRQILWIGAGAFALFLLFVIIFFFQSLCWQCPLCMGRLWLKSGARRHRNTKKAFGISYRLELAISIIFKSKYRCLYCGESFSTQQTREELRGK